MESLITQAPHLDHAPFLLLTVDAIFAPALLRDFLAGAARHRDADVVLAMTDFVDDEKPLRLAVGDEGRVTALGTAARSSPLITAGFYVFHPRVFAEIDAARAARLNALREYLGHLLQRGYRVYAVGVGKSVDVDRPEDVIAAEAFVRSGFAS
jgi:NDP-sugar pyrophosphorylase family protein